MPDEPVAQGSIVLVKGKDSGQLAALAKEAASILRALRAPGDVVAAPDPAADYALILVEEGSDAREVALPDLKDRAGSAIAVADDAAEGRVAIATARKHLRAHNAALGARELVFAPSQFGYLGLESDGARERLEILLRALVVDAERFRLKREGWEEPEERRPQETL